MNTAIDNRWLSGEDINLGIISVNDINGNEADGLEAEVTTPWGQ